MAAPELLFDNRFSDGAITASTTAVGFDVANIVSLRTAEQWWSADTSVQYLTVDCGAIKSADSFGLISNLHEVGGSVAVECSDDNFAADITVAYPATVVNQSVIFPTFVQQDKTQWRLAITGLTGACRVSVAGIGLRLVFDKPITGEFTPAIEKVEPQVVLPTKGQALALLDAYVELSTQAQFRMIDDVWFREIFMPVWDSWLMRYKPFFWSTDRDLCPDDLFFMWIKPGSSLDAAFHPRTWKRHFQLLLVGVKL